MPEVSIIIPTKNRQSLLNHSINSVLNQSYINWELFIVNDATEKKILNYSDTRIHFVENKLSPGANGARNTGIYLSSSKYIAFLDDDDTWDSNKLSKQVKIMNTTDAILSYTGKKIILQRKNVIKKKYSYYSTILNPLLTLHIHNYIGTTSSIMIKTEVLKNKVKFDENIYVLQDYDLYLQLAKMGRIIGIQEHLVTYNFDEKIKHTSFRIKSLIKSSLQIFNKQKGIYRLTIIIGLTNILIQKIYKYLQYKWL